ncbi:MAG: hypothetical protein V4616_10870 [Bacteroidota bacterium]
MKKRATTKFTARRKEIQSLSATAVEASKGAIKESKQLGLTIKLILNKQIIEELPSGERKVVKSISQGTAARTGLKKGMVLCRK